MNELKRELSKLAGIDFFNPKYRDVFKKYLPDEEDADEEVVDETPVEAQTDEESKKNNIYDLVSFNE